MTIYFVTLTLPVLAITQTQFHDLIHCGLHHPCNFLLACDYDY